MQNGTIPAHLKRPLTGSCTAFFQQIAFPVNQLIDRRSSCFAERRFDIQVREGGIRTAFLFFMLHLDDVQYVPQLKESFPGCFSLHWRCPPSTLLDTHIIAIDDVLPS